jgi:hypothetical protein
MEDKNLYQQKILEILKSDPVMSKEFIDYCLLLLAEKGYNLPPALISQMTLDLSMRLEAFIIAYILNSLPYEAYQEIEKMALEEKEYTQEDYNNFLNKYLPNYKEIVKQAIEDFRNTFLGLE